MNNCGCRFAPSLFLIKIDLPKADLNYSLFNFHYSFDGLMVVNKRQESY